MKETEADSTRIKEALLYYFRFNRQWYCADEVSNGCFISDVLVDTGKWTMDVEVKTSKRDLIIGERKKIGGWGHGKNKHAEWPIGRTNKFALCVPEYLQEVAEKWIEETNPKYGLFIYLDNKYEIQRRIWIKQSAKKLHSNYDGKFKDKLLKRLSSIRALTIASNLKKEE